MNIAGARTAGEIRFEQYLKSQNLQFAFEKEHPGRSQRPDYSIPWRSREIVLDVKDFDQPHDIVGDGAYDPYVKIREKIEQGRDKFKQFKDFPCALVLCNLGHPLVDLETADIMLGAMYGDSGFSFPVNTVTGIGDATKMTRKFLGRGKMMRPNWKNPQNTTISALVTLTQIRPHYQRMLDTLGGKTQELDMLEAWDECERAAEAAAKEFDPELLIQRVIIWHNAFARIPFPDDLFRGPYDTHFGFRKEEDGAFQCVTYRGTMLPERVEL
jgi:hypothetical protein